MSEFLAPLDYRRAKDMLRALHFYTGYTPEGADRAAALLRERYPSVFAHAEVKTFANGALLLEMPGANITDPLVFVAHMDALPCREAPRPEGPLCAPLQRAHAVALLEALDALLIGGYRPGGDLYLALSMDGLGEGLGAQAMAAYLAKRGANPCFVLDYGGYATHAAFCRYLPAGAPLALIGITEKGRLDGRVIAPPVPLGDERGAARPLNVLLKSGSRLGLRPRRATLCPASDQMLAAIARHAPMPRRLLLLYPRLTFPLLRLLWRKRAVFTQFFSSDLTVTGVRTQGEPSRSPTAAELSFTLRTVTGRPLTVWQKQLARRVRRGGATLEVTVRHEASPPSRTAGEAWDALETAIEILFERAVIVPCLAPHESDGRFYAGLNGKVYRFSPYLLGAADALRDECGVDDAALQTAVQFFRQMLSV